MQTVFEASSHKPGDKMKYRKSIEVLSALVDQVQAVVEVFQTKHGGCEEKAELAAAPKWKDIMELETRPR